MVADVREIIQKILSDPKIATNSNLASIVYRDEPILMTAPQMARFTPPRIREMRRLARPTDSEAKIFHRQGVFMADFEDDFDFRDEVVRYFPTYQALTDVQLRGYFSWRARARKGQVEKTSLSFAFLYIYELLNQIGVDSPEHGYDALKAFWTAYRDLDSRITPYVTLWLKDYVVYNNLPHSYLDGLPDLAFDDAVAVLLDFRSHGTEAVFSALNSLSSYNLENSIFFKQHPDEVKTVVARVFAVVSDYHNRNAKTSASEKLFGRMNFSGYAMFKSAVFYHRPSRENRVYRISDHYRYQCENGDWFCERFVWFGRNNKRIGAILKTIDYLLRQNRGYKSTLQQGKTNKILTAKIAKEIAKYEQEKRDNAVPEITIDTGKLHAIRAAALATQTRLLVEEPEEPEEALPEETPDAASLTEAERRFLRSLLHGLDFSSGGVPQSVLVDAVNEKLFDRFGDTVIADGDNGPEIIDDYREEVKGMFPR